MIGESLLRLQKSVEIIFHLFSGIMFSIPFLIVTFLIYATTPKLQNLHGMNLMSYVAFLTLSFVFLAIINYGAISVEQLTTGNICKAVGYTFYLCLMTSFFWMNVMSYDIWKTITGGIRDSRRSAEVNRYKMYSKYAYGLPLILLLILAFTDHYDKIPEYLRPNIGDEACFLSSKDFYWPLKSDYHLIRLFLSSK